MLHSYKYIIMLDIILRKASTFSCLKNIDSLFSIKSIDSCVMFVSKLQLFLTTY